VALRDGRTGLSSPAVAGETVFVGSDDGGLYALSSADGTLIWRFASGGAVVSSPVVVGNAVLFGSDDGNLYVLDAKSGRELWRYTAGSPVRASPCVANGVVYFCDGSGGIYALKEGSRLPADPSDLIVTPYGIPMRGNIR
jgi:eukaryotic-like serine/threonine-protein kinase